MTTHRISTEYWNSSNTTVVKCACGWRDRWPGADGSAQQSGAEHLAQAGGLRCDCAPCSDGATWFPHEL